MMDFSFPRRIQREKRRAGANLHDALNDTTRYRENFPLRGRPWLCYTESADAGIPVM